MRGSAQSHTPRISCTSKPERPRSSLAFAGGDFQRVLRHAPSGRHGDQPVRAVEGESTSGFQHAVGVAQEAGEVVAPQVLDHLPGEEEVDAGVGIGPRSPRLPRTYSAFVGRSVGGSRNSSIARWRSIGVG